MMPAIFLFLSQLPFFFFFNDTATTEIYTLSLHDALPISSAIRLVVAEMKPGEPMRILEEASRGVLLGKEDRKSTRLNSSHANISYAVFCLKKKYISSTNMSNPCQLACRRKLSSSAKASRA